LSFFFRRTNFKFRIIWNSNFTFLVCFLDFFFSHRHVEFVSSVIWFPNITATACCWSSPEQQRVFTLNSYLLFPYTDFLYKARGELDDDPKSSSIFHSYTFWFFTISLHIFHFFRHFFGVNFGTNKNQANILWPKSYSNSDDLYLTGSRVIVSDLTRRLSTNNSWSNHFVSDVEFKTRTV
jgi:hypothetical protein